MNGILLCVILFVSLPLHVEDISLLHLTSPESQDNDKQDEGLSKQDALPDNLGQQDDVTALDGGEEDVAVPEMDPASNTPQVMSFNLSSAEMKDSEQVESPPKPEQLKQIEQPGTLYQSDGSAPGSDDLEREKRSPKFDPLPNGDSCLLSGSSGDVYYEYIDATGLECQCELCFPGHIVARNCTCDRSTLDIPQRTECRLVEQGKQYMPVHNKCTKGIDCKACPYPLIVKIECPATSDTECECGSEGYSVDGNDCIPKPRCDVDQEPRFGDGEKHNVMVCVPCYEGYSQPKSNTTDKCRKMPDPTELVTPTPIGSTSQDISIVSETVSPFITRESTQTPAANLTGVPSDDTTDATGTTEDQTLVTGDAIYCLTWKIGIIVGLSILAVGIFIGRVADRLYIKKYYDPLTRKAAVSKDDRSSMELEGVVTGCGDNNRTGDEVNIDEPTSSSPLNASSPDSGRGRGKGRNKRTGKISQARKRGGHGGTN